MSLLGQLAHEAKHLYVRIDTRRFETAVGPVEVHEAALESGGAHASGGNKDVIEEEGRDADRRGDLGAWHGGRGQLFGAPDLAQLAHQHELNLERWLTIPEHVGDQTQG